MKIKWPILLNGEQEKLSDVWAADDRLWTTQETVAFNLRTFARAILSKRDSVKPLHLALEGPTWDRAEEIIGSNEYADDYYVLLLGVRSALRELEEFCNGKYESGNEQRSPSGQCPL